MVPVTSGSSWVVTRKHRVWYHFLCCSPLFVFGDVTSLKHLLVREPPLPQLFPRQSSTPCHPWVYIGSPKRASLQVPQFRKVFRQGFIGFRTRTNTPIRWSWAYQVAMRISDRYFSARSPPTSVGMPLAVESGSSGTLTFRLKVYLQLAKPSFLVRCQQFLYRALYEEPTKFMVMVVDGKITYVGRFGAPGLVQQRLRIRPGQP